METALSRRHAITILTFLLGIGQIKKTGLLEILRSSDSLTETLRALEREGYIKSTTLVMGRKTILIELTAKGRIVADNLKHIEEPRISVRLREEHEVVLKLLERPMTLGELENISKGITGVVRTLKEIGLVKEEISHSTTKMGNMVELTEKGRAIASKFEEMKTLLEE